MKKTPTKLPKQQSQNPVAKNASAAIGGGAAGRMTNKAKRDSSSATRGQKHKNKSTDLAEGLPHDVDHMPGATRHDVAQKMRDSACKRCHGSGYVYKTPDGKVFPNNQPGTSKYKCGACNGIGFIRETRVNELDTATMNSYQEKRKQSPAPANLRQGIKQVQGVRSAKEKIHDKENTAALRSKGDSRVAENYLESLNKKLNKLLK